MASRHLTRIMMNRNNDSSHRSGFHDVHIHNDIEGHPITSQIDEFQFVEASQTYGYTMLDSSGDDSHTPKGGYDLYLRFTSEVFRTPEMEYNFHAFRSAGFNMPLMIASVTTQNLTYSLNLTYNLNIIP